jgi:hypothetical protein
MSALALFYNTVPFKAFDKLPVWSSQLRNSINTRRDLILANYLTYSTWRTKTQSQIDMWSLLLLWFLNMAVMLPMILAMSGFFAGMCGKGCPSMVIALLFMPNIMFLLGACAVILPVATVTADTCLPTLQSTLYLQVQTNNGSAMTLPKENFAFFSLQNDINLMEVAKFSLTCQGKPEIIAKLSDMAGVYRQQGINAYDLQNNMTSIAGIKPVFLLNDELNRLTQTQVSADTMFQRFQANLDCTQLTRMYTDTNANFCQDFSAAISLSGCTIFLMCLCMYPGVVCAIQGYKRFDERNHEGELILHEPDVGPPIERPLHRRQVVSSNNRERLVGSVQDAQMIGSGVASGNMNYGLMKGLTDPNKIQPAVPGTYPIRGGAGYGGFTDYSTGNRRSNLTGKPIINAYRNVAQQSVHNANKIAYQ